MLRHGPPRRSQWPRGGRKAPTRQVKRLSTAAAVPRSAALLTVALERPARCCDRAREPWIAFDGDLSAVTAAAAGAPVAWRLNGDAAVRRSYLGCNEPMLTITTRAAVGPSSACARTSSNDGTGCGRAL